MKGIKRVRNVPVFYDELKDKRNIRLTKTAWNAIVKNAQQQGISASEFIERWGRQLPLLTEKSSDGT